MNGELKNVCNPKIFEKLFKTYSKALKRFLYFKFGDLESAEDVMQEAFIKLWSNCKKVEFEKAKSFLYTVGNNLFINIKKHEKVVRNHQKQIKTYNNDESPQYLLEEKEFYVKIKKTIEALPEKQRVVFLMSRIEKKKYKEIAEELGLSVKAVEKRMHGALIVLREKIGKV